MSSYKIKVEDVNKAINAQRRSLKELAKFVLKEEGVPQAKINIVLVEDSYIIKLNQEFLNTGETTDVISFNLEDNSGNLLEGEVYANTNQIKNQAEEYGITFQNELYRIVIHGILHLIGYKDKAPSERKVMKAKENYYLKNFENAT